MRQETSPPRKLRVNDAVVLTQVYQDSVGRVVAVCEDGRGVATCEMSSYGWRTIERHVGEWPRCGRWIRKKRTWSEWMFGDSPGWLLVDEGCDDIVGDEN